MQLFLVRINLENLEDFFEENVTTNFNEKFVI